MRSLDGGALVHVQVPEIDPGGSSELPDERTFVSQRRINVGVVQHGCRGLRDSGLAGLAMASSVCSATAGISILVHMSRHGVQ
jgi:hypothetical protein